MKIALLTAGKSGEPRDYVATREIPPFQSGPDVVGWGDRVFMRTTDTWQEQGEQLPVYVEAFAYAIVDAPAPDVGPFTDAEVLQDPVLQFFGYAHLQPPLRARSKPFADLARVIVSTLPRNAQRTIALNKLIEAKDAGVRAAIAK